MSELTSLPTLPVMRARRHPLLIGTVALIVAVMVLPIVSLLVLSATSDTSEIADLFTTVLPSSLKTTVQLMLIVGVLTSSIGVVSAYLIITYEFPFRRTLSWMLVLPVAVPAYIASYCFVDFLTFAGPVQTALRGIMGYKTHSDYWFPDIRSVWGAGFILASVLYPYVYLTSRVVFLMQGRNAADVARSLGASRARVFFQVLLPMARPAIAAGVALALMETLNDIGAVEYLGVKTLTFSIYNTWLGRGSIGGAAQLALIMLVLVLALLWVETYARRQLRFNAGRASHILATTSRQKLRGFYAWLAMLACTLPIVIGFGIPFLVLLRFAVKRLDQLASPEFHAALATSIYVGSVTAIVTVGLSLFLLHVGRMMVLQRWHMLVKLATSGYAMPGTVLGLGLLFALTTADGWLNDISRALAGVPVGLVLSGSAFAVILAATIRFMAVAGSTLGSALQKLPPNLDHAARNLGRGPWNASRTIMLPLLRPAIQTGLVLVFVDTIKELSSTILLRPLGFNSLATLVYEDASRAAVADGSVAALAIVVTSLVPVFILSRALAADRHS